MGIVRCESIIIYYLFKMKNSVMLIFCLLVQFTLQTVMAADKQVLSTDSSLLSVDDEAFVTDDYVADNEDNDDEDFGDDEVDEVADKHEHGKIDSIILSSLTEAMKTIDEISESTHGRQVRSAGNLFRTKSRRRSP